MSEIAFEDRLQPALLDRLSDDARTIAVLQLTTTRQRLDERGVSIEALQYALRPFGLRLAAEGRDAPVAPDSGPIELRFVGPTDGATLTRVRAAPVAAKPTPVSVGQVADVAGRTVLNTALESAVQRVVSMRQLRESVLRDLSWLLSTTSFDSDRSLERFPEVARSVINYGLPSVAGRGVSGIDGGLAAARLKKAIEQFEPRLSGVRVTPEFDAQRMDQYAMAFQIEAELWGQPMPQRLLLHTEIDMDTKDVTIRDAGSG